MTKTKNGVTMKLKYVGPRPVITHHGVTFKDGKEDKYVYLPAALEILKSLEQIKDQINEIHYFEKMTKLNDEDMSKMVLKYHPDLEIVMTKEIESFEIHLQNEIDNVSNNHILSDGEKEILRNNFKIMMPYRIQRAKNKIFYFHAIATIAEIIKEKKIAKIVTEFDDKHWHVLHTLEGELARGRFAIRSNLKTFSEEEKLKIAMQIEWI